MNGLVRVLLVFGCLLTRITTLYSQEQIPVQRIEGEFKFDGIVDDACWQNIKPLPMVMHTPTFGNAVSEKSEVMIYYDNTFLYVGARLFDSNPTEMLISSKKRDESMVLSEQLMLIFDSFNDRSQSFNGGITGLKALVMFSTKLSISTFI